MQLAAIDLGTNSIHMIIVHIGADLRFSVIDRAKEMVRLGQGTFETGRLDEDAQRRALEVLSRFRRLADRRGVERYVAVATSAIREAENGGAFLQEVYRQTGVYPRLISGTEEARTIFKAVQRGLSLDESNVLVVDLGGGSAEFACGSARQLAWCTSLKLGAQRLAPHVLQHGEVERKGREGLRDRLQYDLLSVAKRAEASRIGRCYVTSGSAVAVLKILRAKGVVADDDVAIPVKALADLEEAFAAQSRKERAKTPGLDGDRVDLIVAALVFFRALGETLNLPALHVSECSLREGLVYEFLDVHGGELQWELTEPNARRRSVLQFAERFHYDAPHALHVASLVVNLFDAMRDLHGLGEPARELLEYGAILHDVGYVVAPRAHHKHSEYLILNGLMGGFTEAELRAIAGIARYHRKGAPKGSHDNWGRMDEMTRDVVLKGSALLRIADGLDRSHGRVVTSIQPVLEEGALTVTVTSEESADMEVWAATQKGKLFTEVFEREVCIIVAPHGDPGMRVREGEPGSAEDPGLQEQPGTDPRGDASVAGEVESSDDH